MNKQVSNMQNLYPVSGIYSLSRILSIPTPPPPNSLKLCLVITNPFNLFQNWTTPQKQNIYTEYHNKDTTSLTMMLRTQAIISPDFSLEHIWVKLQSKGKIFGGIFFYTKHSNSL